MLSEFLTSSYLQYKADTDAVASWLASVAKKCGFPVDTLGGSPSTSDGSTKNTPVPSKRLKGKARKQARENQSKPASPSTTAKPTLPKHTIAVKDFVSLADYIAAATNPTINVPASFITVLDRAILTRRSHGIQVESEIPQTASSQASSDRHGYFIGVLEHVREVLRPRMSSDQVQDPLTQPVGEGPTENMLQTLTNKFDGLDVEEPSESFLKAPNVTPKVTTASKPEVDYEAERMQDFEEAYLGFNLLLQDFRNLRTVISRTWAGYQYGMFDLVSAAITTNTAIDIARRMQQDVQRLFDKHGGSETMLNIFYGAVCMAEGEDPNFREQPGDDLNFRVYNMADSMLLPPFMLLQSFSVLVEEDNFLPFKTGYYGSFDRASDRSRKSAKDKFQEDKIILLEILSEFLTLHRTSPAQPFEDEFTRGLRQMFDTHEIPLWLVFAAQVFLDIHHTLRGNVEKGFADLRASANIIKGSITNNLKFHSDLRIQTWPKSNDKAFHSMLDLISSWLDTDPIESVKERLGLRPGEQFKLMKWHPLFCGIWIYNIKAQFQDIGITFQGAWGSVMYSAHLYNALCKEKLIKGHWVDMDLILAWHDEIFVGEPPSKPEDYLKRFSLSMGWSAASYARNRRQAGRLPESKSGPKGMKMQASVSKMFMDRYCEGTGQTDLKEADLEKILAESMWESDGDSQESEEEGILSMSRGTKAATKRRWDKYHRLSATEMLESLRNSLQSEAPELAFDYLAMHRMCWRLLRLVKDACDERLRSTFGFPYIENETQLPFVVGYIFKAVAGSDRLGSQVAQRGDVVKSKLLMTAAPVVNSMIEEGAGRVVQTVLASQGYPIEFEVEEEEPEGTTFFTM